TADKFKYDPLLSIVICPAGRLTSMNHNNESAGATIYHFSATFCSNCPQKKYCTRSDRGRTITIEDTWAVADDARRYLGTPEAKQDMRIRSQLERVNNELKNNLGLKVCRFYGLAKHQIQLHATSFVYNIRQTVRLIMRENSKKVAANNVVQ
ncbi:MAG: transposase, partial [Bacteroidales bacterium]|nr:transposase [Bacteroidales bacterium]